MSDLIERLRRSGQADNGTHYGPVWYRNPDGPEAAARIEALEAEVERLRAELDEERERHDQARAEVDVLLPPNPTFYMDPPDGGNVDRVEVVRRYIEDLRSRIPDPDDLEEAIGSLELEANATHKPHRKASYAEVIARLRATLPTTKEES
jgi:hypothetical protein